MARLDRQHDFIGVLGPTNTGKTHYAIERMMGYASGMIGFPLRLLAREVYDRVVRIKGKSRVALITGEEKIIPDSAVYFLCTVESMPVSKPVEFLAIDEIQLCEDPQRGHIFTQRLLGARGLKETMFMGSMTIRSVLTKAIPDIHIISRPRFSTLRFSEPKKLSKLPRRSAVVAFRADEVYALAELLRRKSGGAAIIMGALSPKTRNAQAELFQSGEVDYLVATDAIGMGLNLDIDHIVLAESSKFDGRKYRALHPHELAQVAGRAGRHMNDGTFSFLAGQGIEWDQRTIDQICDHQFAPIKSIYWRNASLDYSSPKALYKSLEMPPHEPEYLRPPIATDMASLDYLLKNPDIASRATNPEMVQKLWAVCQIPDFEKLGRHNHQSLLARIYMELSEGAEVIPHDWMARQVTRLDNLNGDIDTLSGRIAAIRIWTYISHQKGWLKEQAHWSHYTRSLEDKLSDALHHRLTQRFVDTRTSVLMRELRQKDSYLVSIENDGKIEVEGLYIGDLKGFSFYADASAESEESKALKSAGEKVLRKNIADRVKRFVDEPAENFSLETPHGLSSPELHWNGHAIAHLNAGISVLTPRVKLLQNNLLNDVDAAKVLEKAQNTLDNIIAETLLPISKLLAELNGTQAAPEDAAPLNGITRGIAFQICEHMGILPRSLIANEIRQVDQEARKGLRRFGIRIGASNLFMPYILKPAATRLRLILWALYEKVSANLPPLPTPGMVWCEIDNKAPEGFYRMAGFQTTSGKAVRVDMMERLADAVRDQGKKGDAFEVSPETMGLVGLSGLDFALVMKEIGYIYEKIDLPEPTPTKDEALEAETGKNSSQNKSTTSSADRYKFSWKNVYKKSTTPAKKKDAGGEQKSANSGKDNTHNKKLRPKKKQRPQEKPIDMNSPFAALQSLKDALTKQAKKK